MKNIIILLAAIFLFAVSSFAQIRGRIVDPQGNGVSYASVWATGDDGAVAATAMSDSIGNYILDALQPGKYKVTARGPATFQQEERNAINVAQDQTTTLDIMLTPVKVDPTASTLGYIKIINDFPVNIELTWDSGGQPIGVWRSAGSDMPATGEETSIDLPSDAANIRLRARTILGSGDFDRILTVNDLNKCYRTTGSPDRFFDNGCVHIDKAEIQRQQLSSWIHIAAGQPAGHINEQASYAALLTYGIELGWQAQMTIYQQTPVCTDADIRKEPVGSGRPLSGCRLQVSKGIPLNNSPAYQCEKVFGAGKCTPVYLKPGANDSGNPANGVRGYIGRCPAGQFILHRYPIDPVTAKPAADDYYCARPSIPK